MKNFAIIGVAGYIAPKHLDAIQKTGNHLLAAFDLSDSVGIMDRYFPKADFFTEYERFDRHLELLKERGSQLITSLFAAQIICTMHIYGSVCASAPMLSAKNRWYLTPGTSRP